MTITSPFRSGRLCSDPVLIPALIGPPQQCTSRVFQCDKYGDHLQTCQIRSVGLPSQTLTNLMTVVRSEILHYRRIYLDLPDPTAFLPFVVDRDTTDRLSRLYDDFTVRLLFLHAHREASALSDCLMNCQRNRISFDFFELFVWLILRFCWLDFG
jgi:hypothetical protein